jgi:hypothetical protein
MIGVIGVTDCSAPDPSSVELLREARRLGREGRLFEAKRALVDALSRNGQSADLLQELAQIECIEEDYARASTHLADAAALAPYSVTIACDRVKTMIMAGLYSEARSIVSGFPDKLQNEPSIRAIHGDLYRAIGWQAHAVDAYGSRRDLPARARYSSSLSWLRTGGPVSICRSLIRVEENSIDDIWGAKSIELHATLVTLDLPQRRDLTWIGIKLDTSFLLALRAETRLAAAEKRADSTPLRLGYFGFPWLLALAFIYIFWRSVSNFGTAAFLALDLTEVAVIIIFVLRFVIDRLAAHPFDKAYYLYGYWPLEVASLGLVTSFLVRAYTLPAIAGLIAVIVGISYRVGLGSNDKWENKIAKLAREYPREFALNHILYTLNKITDPDHQNNLEAREQWVGNLRDAAQTMERFLPRAFEELDPAIMGQIITDIADAAAAIRTLACRIAVPVEETWDQLISDLRHNAIAIALGNFGSLLPKHSSFADQVRTRRRAVINILVVATALVLLAGLVAALIVFRDRTMANLAETTAVTTFVALLVGVLAKPLQGSLRGDQTPQN